MEKIRFSKMEVLSFVEDLILDEMATEDELAWYEDFKWDNKFKTNYTYKKLVSKMIKEYKCE